MKRTALANKFLLTALSLLLATAIGSIGCSNKGSSGSDGAQGPAGPAGPPGDPGGEPVTALEACIGCHGENGAVPVGDIEGDLDAHFVDTDPLGPRTASGYRQLNVAVTAVNVSGSHPIIDFTVTDEFGASVADLFAADGRFTIARLNPAPPSPGTGFRDADTWESLITRTETIDVPPIGPGMTPATQANSEAFSSGTFQYLGVGKYRYTSNSSFNPSTAIDDGDTMRVAIQISQGDLPAGNGWCDFDANISPASPNDCTSPVSVTRDIVQTATCNGCHGVTSDTRLALHGGGRTDVEYCVTCHNPGTTDANSGNTVDFPVLVHKIHYGSSLVNGYKIWGFGDNLHDYGTVSFTKDIDDCTVCHTGAGADVDNWSIVPTREACGSCHDYVNFATGANHGMGGMQTTNDLCVNCHPQAGPRTAGSLPVETVHVGAKRRMEGALYAGANGYSIDDVSYNPSGRRLTVEFSVKRGGMPMDLATAPEWKGGGGSRLALVTGWNTDDYTNTGSGSNPAQPISVNVVNNGVFQGAAVTETPPGSKSYVTTVALPSSATSGTVTVGLEGHPAADLDADGTFGESGNLNPTAGDLRGNERIAVKNAFAHYDVVRRRTMTLARRTVIDMDKCNQCHDSAGNGLSLHGNNRTAEEQVCVLCHNANATDINRRPAPPAMTVDGKKEQAIDFKHMIHKIHSGAELQDGIVVYGFGGSTNDFSHVEFIGNRANCETCHVDVDEDDPETYTYSTEKALETLPTTVDTGADLADPDDDLNISAMASACSGCHDDTVATDHMKLNGASFHALDADIHQD